VRHRQGREDRRHRRFDVEGVTGNLHFADEVAVQNVSAGGMQVVTGTHLTVGRRYSFRLRHVAHAVQLVGRVVWCALRGTTKRHDGEVVPAYAAGVAFERTLTEEGQELVDFIRDSVSFQPEHRVFGRVQVAASGTATVAAELDFVARRLSLSGMLIVCDLVPQLEQVFPFEVRLGAATLNTSGRVAFVRKLPGKEHMAEIGVEFRDLGDGQQRTLARFIEQELAAQGAAGTVG
jgi:Tfp pilus assembly protein PilZ